MKKVVSILFVFFLTYISQGQNQLNELSNFIRETNSIENLKTIRNKNLKSFYINHVTVDIERKIDFELNHLRITVHPIPGEFYVINIIHRNDSIIIGNVSEQTFENNRKIKSNLFFKENDKIVRDYINKHNIFYGSNQTDKDFYDTLMFEHRIGFSCGETGKEITPISKKTLRYIKNKNFKKLNDLLFSMNPEFQSLGAFGLLKLNKLNNDQLKIIEHLKERNSTLFSCSGCLNNFGEKFSDFIRL